MRLRRIGLVAIGVGLLLGGCFAAAPAPGPTRLPTEAQASPAAAVVAASATPTVLLTATASPAATPTIGSVAPRPATPKPAATRPGLGLLTLLVSEPEGDTVEVAPSARSIAVAGKTRPDAVVSVNGVLVVPDASGAFRVEVPLDDELSLVEVIASDAAGRQLREQFVVVRSD